MEKKIMIIFFLGLLLIIVSTNSAGAEIKEKIIKNEEIFKEITYQSYYHADAGKTYSGLVNEKIIFDGSSTYVDNNEKAIYKWDFGDHYTDESGFGIKPIHIYSNPGVYYVTLTVIDDSGNNYIDIAPVYIGMTGNHLKPYGGCAYVADINEEILFDGSGSTNEENEVVEWFWSFGDGKTAYGQKVKHSYDEERVYIITLYIKDKNGFTRHDVLHADIGNSFSSLKDLFRNDDKQLEGLLNFLLNKEHYTQDIYSKLLDLKIYTNYNNNEKLTNLEGVNPLPIEIDVNDNGVKDIRVNGITFFNGVWAPSMFNEQSPVWLQFETKISSIEKISNDILAEDDFTLCLQMDFNIIADKLDLDDTITRIGYYSPSGEVKPNSITLVHILRPYFLFRIFGPVSNPDQNANTDTFYIASSKKNFDDNSQLICKNFNTFSNSMISNNFNNNKIIRNFIPNLDSDYLIDTTVNGEEYWPEYGFRIQSSGGGSFSLLTMFLNQGSLSKTSIKISYGSSVSTLMYKRTKTGGVLNHMAVFEIPGNSAELTVIRDRNSQITELSANLSFSTKMIRGVSWSDEGINVGFLGQTSATISNFYLNNPGCTLSIRELSLSSSGSFNLNIIDDVKLSVDGSAGFILSDLSFNSKISDFDAKILGTLSMNVESAVHTALSNGLLEIGFDGEFQLINDCTFIVNDVSVIVLGDFNLDSQGLIAFSWDSNEFKIDLQDGVLLNINNLNFEVGQLTAYADLVEIETSGLFSISWDTANNEVTISGGSDAALGLKNVNIIYGGSLEINIFGSLDVQANGYITFGPDVFKAGFSGSLNLGENGGYCEFAINGESLKVGGLYTFTGGNGELSFSWDENGFTIYISGNPELSVKDLYFNIGSLIVKADNIGIGVSGQFNIEWDSADNEVTISSGSDTLLSISNLDINYGSDIQINIIGSLEIQADGYITFGTGVFKVGFNGIFDLGGSCEFFINGESLKVGGLFSFSDGNGEINFIWDENELTLDVTSSSVLSVEDLYFEVENLMVTSEFLEIGISGEFNIDCNTATNEITISGGSGVGISVTNLYIDFNGIIEVEIVGSFELQAEGYITFSPGSFLAGFTGSLNLGTGCTFIINGDSITVGGLFTLSSGSGEIGFLWDNNEFTLYVSGGSSVNVTNLLFEKDNIIVNCDQIGIGVNGQFNLDWDTANNELIISSGAGVTLEITNIDFLYGTTLDVSIIGTLNIQANGYILLAPGIFEAGFTGSLNLGTGCEFEVNGNNITVGGLFTLSGSGGIMNFYWSDNTFVLDVLGSQSLNVTDFYFEAGLLEVSGENIGIGISGEFNLDWDTVTSEVTFSGNSGVSLSIENVNITYSTTLEVKIIGSFNIQAGGYITFGPGIFKAYFSGTLNLGTSCEFIINGNSVNVGGVFYFSTGSGEISFLWENNQFVLDVNGNPQLTVSNLYFEAEIQNKILLINANQVQIGAGGDMTLNWDSTLDEITISSEANVLLLISNIDISYGSDIDISIIGTLSIQANGYITLATGFFEASFLGSLTLSPGFGFEINGDNILLSGIFDLNNADGIITITWEDDSFSCDVDGDVFLDITDLFFELNNIKIDADLVNVNLNGDFTLYLNKNIKKFEISSSVTFGINNLYFYTKESNQWYTICSVQNFEIIGGGYLLLESGTYANIVLDFNSQLNIVNLDITPPTSWYCDLSIASMSISGNAYIIIEKTTNGDGEFSITESSGIVSGHITLFDVYIKLSGTDFEISLTSFDFQGAYSIIIDNTNNAFQVIAEGSIDLTDFDATYGDVDIILDINFNGNGNIITQYNQNNLDIYADVNFIWDIWLESNIIGDWEAHGNLVGNADINAIWQTESGNIKVTINEPGIFHNLEIFHDNLGFSLSNISLNPGIVEFKWQRNDASNTGNIIIESDFNQDTTTLNLIEIIWGTKSASIGWPEIKSGDIKFSWDIPNRFIKLNNGIANLGPSLKYKDNSQSLEISGTIGNLQSDYSKTILLKWFELNNEISGFLIDTANSHLAELLQFKVIKANTGKKIVIYGLQCDDFYITKDSSNNLKFGGHIYIANHLIYSKLESSSWKDFDIQWDFQSTEKWVKFTKDPAFDFTMKLLSVDILGFQFTATVDFINPDYFEVKWNIDVSGKVSIDSNWNYLSTITFDIWHNSGIGLEITANALRAENWWVTWTAWPPEEWNIQSGGSLQIGSINIDVYYNNEWKHLWPW